MSVRSFGILFLFFFPAFSNAQILEINQPLFSEEPFFNNSFIKANKIKSITGSRSSKKVRDIIREQGLDYQYIFSPNGSLRSQLTTFFKSKNQKDTNVISYQYNDKGKLIIKRKSDNYGFFSHNYQYNNKGNIIKQRYCRDENLYTSKNEFKLLKQYIITSDSFSFERISDQQIKKRYLNNHGKVYKEQTQYFNEYDYLIEEYAKFIIGNKKSRKTYEYDEKGRVKKVDDYNSISKNKKTSKKYFYDEVGNILEIKVYKDDKYTTSQQYLYDEKTMLLTAQLVKDIETEFIKIIKYRYTFFEEN